MEILVSLHMENRKIEELYEAYRKAKSELTAALMAENVVIKEEQPK